MVQKLRAVLFSLLDIGLRIFNSSVEKQCGLIMKEPVSSSRRSPTQGKIDPDTSLIRVEIDLIDGGGLDLLLLVATQSGLLPLCLPNREEEVVLQGWMVPQSLLVED